MDGKVLRREEFGGSSFPVESVQALASKNSNEIPNRYLCSDLELHQVSVDESFQIPIIDLSNLAGNPMSLDQELSKLHLACKDWGFFQLINHGVPEEVIEKMKIDIEDFFKLPLEEKKAYAQLPNDIEGYGQAFVVSEDQKLDWGDMLFLVPRPLFIRNMRFWPIRPASFRETLDKYSLELQKVAMKLLELMFVNSGVKSETLASLFEDGPQAVRMNFYPPCTEANKVMGLSPHTDATGLTLLAQLNDVHGLQVKKDGKWVPVKPIPGAFIVNVGDVIEIMSNGEYKSIEHRAVVNPEKQRLSIAAFHSLNLGAMIGPLPELIQQNQANYKTITHQGFVKLLITSKLDGKSLLEQMKLDK